MNPADQADERAAEHHPTGTPSAHLYYRAGPASGDQLAPIRRALTDWARGLGAAEDTVEAIILATDEAMSNVISHAYPGRTGEFELRAGLAQESGRIEIVVRDHGRWQPPGAPDPRHGRGLPLIRALAKQSSIDRTATGTTVRMSWPLAGN
ncbi:MAG TPA: ATP-binding protein [Pseudonocardiaceae bacterium]|jgi:anti-sigma regulatory factor (Ser/Thr protein kinase)|nr:ATP-binding protein [Pseudonocardiaceae bacterium]